MAGQGDAEGASKAAVATAGRQAAAAAVAVAAWRVQRQGMAALEERMRAILRTTGHGTGDALSFPNSSFLIAWIQRHHFRDICLRLRLLAQPALPLTDIQ